MKTRLLDSLTEFTPRNMCFAEQDAETPAGGGGEEAEPELILDEDAPSDEQPDEDAEEIEVGPNRFKLKKSDPAAQAVKEAWNGMQRTHTERSEKISAQEKTVQTREKEIEERVKVVQSFPREIAKVTQLQEQLESYQKVDWAKLRMSGEMVQVDGKEVPLAEYHWGLFQNAQVQLQTAAGDLKNKIEAEQAKRDGAMAQQKTAYHTEMAAKVKDWSPQKDQELRDYAVKNGAPKELIDTVYHPALMMFAQKAMAYDRAMEKAKAAKANSRQDNEPPLEPPKGLKTGNGSPKRTLENARSAEEYQRIRQEQMAKEFQARTGHSRRH